MTPTTGSDRPTDERRATPPRRLGPSWSWRVGRLFGISIYVHATLVLLLAWIAVAAYAQGGNLLAAAEGVALVVSLFATIAAHELAHALTARRFGVGTRDITLLPIGGVSSLERMPERPSQEMLVSLAGPALNVAAALVLAAAIAATGGSIAPRTLDLVGGPFAEKLLWMNVSLAVFNLIPAFPMDGGRVLRAALSTRMDPVRATTIAARTSQALAVGFGLFALYGNFLLLLIALFVWMGAEQELAATRVRAALRGVRVGSATTTRLEMLRPEEPLSRAMDLLLASSQQDFPVMLGPTAIGVLTRNDLVRGLAEGGPDEPVAQSMHRDFDVADANDRLDAFLDRLNDGRAPIVVRDAGRVVGLLTRENLAKLLMTREALRSAS
jgi:Zn-dependent protease/CBS domain-containing protein